MDDSRVDFDKFNLENSKYASTKRSFLNQYDYSKGLLLKGSHTVGSLGGPGSSGGPGSYRPQRNLYFVAQLIKRLKGFFCCGSLHQMMDSMAKIEGRD